MRRYVAGDECTGVFLSVNCDQGVGHQGDHEGPIVGQKTIFDPDGKRGRVRWSPVSDDQAAMRESLLQMWATGPCEVEVPYDG